MDIFHHGATFELFLFFAMKRETNEERIFCE
jgi:hypothetical protein